MKRINGRQYQLESGRLVVADHGVLGLGVDPSGRFHVYHGFDGEIDTRPELSRAAVSLALTLDEQKELADYMVAQWMAALEQIQEAARGASVVRR